MAMMVGELKEEFEEQGEAKLGNKLQGMAAPAAPHCAIVSISIESSKDDRMRSKMGALGLETDQFRLLTLLTF